MTGQQDIQDVRVELELLIDDPDFEGDRVAHYVLGWVSGAAVNRPQSPVAEVLAEAIAAARKSSVLAGRAQ